ncbi:MAG: hypothetical protein KIT83_01035 [Bryobacterales bacterium]|nr:hypothetical protein [Bryobacterales bacterium]
MTSPADYPSALMGDAKVLPVPSTNATEAEAPNCTPACTAPCTGEAVPLSLPRMRARLLEALNREDFRTIQRELPHYQGLLEADTRNGVTTPERLARLEAEHQRFHEQLRATLLTARISLRLEIERVRASRQYAEEDSAPDAVSFHG